MPKSRFREVDGETISINHLCIQRARAFALLIEGGATPYAAVIECRQRVSHSEVIVVELRPTVPQRPKVDIRRLERVGVEFKLEDSWYPDARALREDFPRDRVLHLNGGVPANEPPSLCLFAEPWQDTRLHLTANELLFRLQNWFDDTAAGKLHRPDQLLEPTFVAKSHLMIVSGNIGDRLSRGDLSLNLDIINTRDQAIFVERKLGRVVDKQSLPALVVPVVSDLHEHSYRLDTPSNLWDLHTQLEKVGIDLLRAVQVKLLSIENEIDNYAYVVVLVLLQRQRSEDSDAEPELVAFACAPPCRDPNGLRWLRAAVGLSSDGTADATKHGQTVPVVYLSVRYELSATSASRYGGLEETSGSFVAIGGGAIGSQFLMTLVRSGLVHWTIIDDDILLPHNLVRHSLAGRWVGQSKAKALAFEANSILDDRCVSPIIADLLNPKEEQSVIENVLKEADAVVDLSASVAVARHLACDIEGVARRCSVFVSPSGNDLVFLGEDAERIYRLDSIEVQYYREVAQNRELAGHWQGGSQVGSCRDVTSRVPQHMMGVHAAQATRIFQSWLKTSEATAVIVRAVEGTFAFSQILLSLGTPVYVGKLGGWTIVTDTKLLESLCRQRTFASPNETGGVLLAHVDAQRQTLYVCHHLPAPVDSQHQPTVYIRGCEGLEDVYGTVREKTLNTLGYIGEWHSHPDGCDCGPSAEDVRAGAWLADQTRSTSVPGIMLILCEGQQACWMLCEHGAMTDSPTYLSLTWSNNSP